MSRSKTKPDCSKVALVGFAPSCKLTPFDRDDMHFWGMNDLWKALPEGRWHGWFDMHHKHVMLENPRSKQEHWTWMKGAGFPIWTLDRIPELPTSEAFPLEAANALGIPLPKVEGSHYVYDPDAERPAYYTSTCAYMIALAILKGYEEIHIYGINLIGREEYLHQRPNMEYWIGVAHGRGIRVVIPPECTILKSRFRYGYDTHKEDDPIVKHLKFKLLEHEQKRQQARAGVTQLDAACETLKYAILMHEHANHGGTLPDTHKELPSLGTPEFAKEYLRGEHEEQLPENGQGGVQPIVAPQVVQKQPEKGAN